MEESLKNIENTYDILAEEWARSFLGEHDNKPKDQEILHKFSREIGRKNPVWDMGCGPGNTTRFLKDLGMDISGLDLSAKMVEQAKAHYPQIDFRKGNLLELPFPQDSIAGIVAFYAMVHFTKDLARRAFQEIFRVLEPGGIFLFAYHVGDKTIHLEEFLGKRVDVDFFFFPTDFITSSLQKCGFERIEIIERKPYPQIEYQSLRAYSLSRKPFRQEEL